MKGYFISIEGIEGVGKSTAMTFIKKVLKEHQVDYLATREPGGTPLAEAIRRLMLHDDSEPMCVDTELLLVFAGRAQHLAQVILPALARGQWVISDRFVDASFAYQGAGRGIDMARVQALAKWVLGDLRPDLTLLLDAPVEVSIERMRQRSVKDRIEKEDPEFFARVRDGYLKLAQHEPKRFKMIDAEQPVKMVQQKILQLLQPLLNTTSSVL